jgi:hypothetical protein
MRHAARHPRQGETMMKATKKLVVRREAVRTLASVELRTAAGGSVIGLATEDSGAKACGTTFAADSGAKACGTSVNAGSGG